MHRIGEFASLTGLSVKTLRFYDEIGLLTPATVGSQTGYRLYSAGQVDLGRYIVSLRQLGLALAEIKAILATGASEREALEAARDRLASSLSEGRRLLSGIEARLAELPSGGGIRLSRLSLMSVVSIRQKVASTTEAENILLELEERLHPLCGLSRGVLWHHCADSGYLEAEPFVQIPPGLSARSVRGLSRGALTPAIRVSELPAVDAACTSSADDEVLAERAYLSLREWLPSHGYELSAAKREVVRWQGGMRTLEIQFPVSRSRCESSAVRSRP